MMTRDETTNCSTVSVTSSDYSSSSESSPSDDEASLCPTPIASFGLTIVGKEEIGIDGNLVSMFQDDGSLQALLNPLKESSQKEQFRPYQADKWNERFQELVDYKNEFGHCNVPYQWSGGVSLAQWVKRQRHQFKLKQEGRHSNLSDERLSLLNELGFVWDSRAAAWEERFEELKQFKKLFGHCKVTRKHVSYRTLAVWLKRQRHQCRLCLANSPDRIITLDQCRRLLDLGLQLNYKRD